MYAPEFDPIPEEDSRQPTPDNRGTKPTPLPTMFHVIEPYEADTFFTHGARELQYDSYSESHYYLVPYSGGYVIRQDFGNKKNKGKAREKNLFEKYLMGYYRCLWSGICVPSIIGVSRGDMEPCFIIYKYESLVILQDAMQETQRSYKELPHDMQITGQSMWHSLSQRHHVTLENELIDSEVMFVIEGSEAKLLDLWSTLRGRLGVAVGNIQQRWDGGML